MSFASTLQILRPSLPYYIAVARYDLLHIGPNCFEFRPDPAAPPIALQMAATCFSMGASSCTESFVMSRTLAEGPKVFTFDALTCEALENFDLSIDTKDYLQPFPSVVIQLPEDYTKKRMVPFSAGSHLPLRHSLLGRLVSSGARGDNDRRTRWARRCSSGVVE